MIFVARHAPVAVKGLCYGQSEVPTSVDDLAACEAIHAQLRALGANVTRVWSSPWSRARGPAERLAERLGVRLAIDARLSELAFGAWEGRAYAQLETEASFQAWMRDWQTASPPGGERLEQLRTRVREWRDEVLAAEGIALAITHAGVIRTLRADRRHLDYASVVTEAVEALRVEPAC